MSAPTPTLVPTGPPDRPALEVVVKGVRFTCADSDIIGRQGTVGTTVTAHLTAMSRRHLLVDWRGTIGGWHVTLLPTARFETLLDGTPMVRDAAVRLLPGTHRVSIEGTVFDLCVVAPEALPTELAAAPLLLPPGLKRLRKEFGGADGLLRLIAENVADLIAVIDHEGKRVWNNAAYFTCLGYSPEEINASYSMAEIHPEDLPLVKEGFARSMATGVGERLEYRMHHRNGHWVHLESQGRVVQSASGEQGKYLVLVARDVTARKQAEQRAEKRVQQLVARTDTLAQFTRSRSFQDGDVEKCFAMVTEAAVRHFEGERADVWLFAGDGQTLRRAETYARHAATTHDDATLRADACPRFLAALRAERCVEVADARSDERMGELYEILLESHGAVSFLAARIGLGDELLGMLTLERTEALGPWSLEDETFAASLADTLLMALHARRRAEAFAALQKSQQQNAADLAGAAAYVRALLPQPLDGKDVASDWRFTPCEALGGDGFGHFWLDDDRLAVFLIDAVGHGVNAALLAISIINILRSSSLPGTDFHDPAAVLANLNAAFQMESQHNMFFTIWYGVWDRRSREMKYATAGHPPAVLFGLDRSAAPATLGGNGLMIGGSPDSVYENGRAAIPANGRLYVFSDGAYELIDPDGNAWGFDAFLTQLGQPPPPGGSELDELHRELVRVNGGRTELPDDFSILRLTFQST